MRELGLCRRDDLLLQAAFFPSMASGEESILEFAVDIGNK